MDGIRVLVIEQSMAVRVALVAAFHDMGCQVRAEAEGRDLARLVHQFQPDLAVIDVRVSAGAYGYRATRRLKAAGELPAVILTGVETLGGRLTTLVAEGVEHVGEAFTVAEVLVRARPLLARARRLPSAPLHAGDLVVDDSARKVRRAGAEIELTRTQYDLLVMLCRHPGQILTKRQLLVSVWGFDGFDENLVEVHLSALRRRLEAHGPRLIHTVRGVGYILRTGDDSLSRAAPVRDDRIMWAASR